MVYEGVGEVGGGENGCELGILVLCECYENVDGDENSGGLF